jgi:hypothetical protein
MADEQLDHWLIRRLFGISSNPAHRVGNLITGYVGLVLSLFLSDCQTARICSQPRARCARRASAKAPSIFRSLSIPTNLTTNRRLTTVSRYLDRSRSERTSASCTSRHRRTIASAKIGSLSTRSRSVGRWFAATNKWKKRGCRTTVSALGSRRYSAHSFSTSRLTFGWRIAGDEARHPVVAGMRRATEMRGRVMRTSGDML